MKDKMFTLIIGILIGAIFATGGFFIYEKVIGGNQKEMPNMQENGRIQAHGNGEEPPEKPDNDNGEPPQMLENNTNTTSTNSNT